MKKLAITLMVLGAVTLSAQATVTYNLQAAYVYGDSGTTLLPMECLVAFIADVDGDGFGNWDTTQLGATGFTIDADDVVLGVGSSGSVAEGMIDNGFMWTNAAGYEGKEWAMVWFNTAYVAGATGGGEGVNYGVYETGEVVGNQGSTYGPSDPEVDGPWYTQEVGGSIPDVNFYSRYTTAGVPEPMTVTLLLVGGGLLAARRSVKRRCA